MKYTDRTEAVSREPQPPLSQTQRLQEGLDELNQLTSRLYSVVTRLAGPVMLGNEVPQPANKTNYEPGYMEVVANRAWDNAASLRALVNMLEAL